MLSPSERPWKILHFFFDFRAGKGIANDIVGLLRSLCLQVVRTLSDKDHDLETLLGNLKDSQWNRTTLKNTLTDLIQGSPSSLCIFIDGLDEYQDHMHELLETLLNISPKADGGPNVKLCLASRPEPVIAVTLARYSGLAMHDHNKEAIEQYVSASIKNLHWSSEDESRLLQLSWRIADKAEGIFLWARFALSELIESHAMGESSDELFRRLEALPVSMEDLYANIFSRMKSQDRDDAQLLFQLVCSSLYSGLYEESRSSLTVRQLKEANAVAENRLHDIQLEYDAGLLENYERLVKAKSGGLLECLTEKAYRENYYDEDDHDEYTEDEDTEAEMACDEETNSEKTEDGIVHDEEPYDEASEHGEADHKADVSVRTGHSPGHPRVVKTIHRSVINFLKKQGWLNNFNVRSQVFRSPDALWVYICCKYLDKFFKDHLLELGVGEMGRITTQRRLRSSLFEYCKANLFKHARRMERGCDYYYEDYRRNVSEVESAFEYLCLVPDTIWSYLWKRSPRRPWSGQVELDWDAIETFRKSQPWQSMVQNALHLTVENALSSKKYSVTPHGYDISLVLMKWAENSDLALKRHFDLAYEPYHQLIVALIKYGARPGMKDILICLEFGRKRTLEKLLETWPSGRIELNRGKLYVPCGLGSVEEENYTYNGEAVGPLWELARMRSSITDFETILDYFLGRGEDINATCGPGGRGTMLHALIIGVGPYAADDIEALIRRGVEVDVCGTWGTPLQMVWKILRYCEPFRELCEEMEQAQAIMILLRDHGANCEWIEPDGTVVTQEDINALCSMNSEQLMQQNESRFQYPGYYTWETFSEYEERLMKERTFIVG